MSDAPVRWCVGCMTGTSLDGLDAALVRVEGEGLSMSAEVVGHHAERLPEGLAGTLRSLAEGTAHPAADFLRAGREVGGLYARGVAALLERCGAGVEVDLVAAHGQTVWHIGEEHLSWQLFDPWPLVREVGAPVVFDLRQADLIAGGQGAPITPIADPILYGRDRRLAVVNLGGVCNYTVSLPAEGGGFPEVVAGDLCPCNLMLDGLARALLGRPYDKDGEVGSTGRVDDGLVGLIEAAVGDSPRTLGREQFGQAWVDGLIAKRPEVGAGDWLASAAGYVGRKLAGAIDGYGVERAVLAGGGSLNPALVAQIAGASGQAGVWMTSEAAGIAGEAREAACFAVLGALSADGVPITLEGVTGAQNPGVAGSWAWPSSITG